MCFVLFILLSPIKLHRRIFRLIIIAYITGSPQMIKMCSPQYNKMIVLSSEEEQMKFLLISVEGNFYTTLHIKSSPALPGVLISP